MDNQLLAIEKTVASSSKRLNTMLDKLRIRTTNMSEKTAKEIAAEAREKEMRKAGKGKTQVPRIRKPPKRDPMMTTKTPEREIKVGGKAIPL